MKTYQIFLVSAKYLCQSKRSRPLRMLKEKLELNATHIAKILCDCKLIHLASYLT